MGINYIDTNFGNLSNLDYKNLNVFSRNQVEISNIIDTYPLGIIGWRKSEEISVSSTTPAQAESLTINIDRRVYNYSSSRLIKVTLVPMFYRNTSASNFLVQTNLTITEKFEADNNSEVSSFSDNVIRVYAGHDTPAGTHVLTTSMSSLPGITTVSVTFNLDAAGTIELPSGAYILLEDMGRYTGVTT